MDGLRDAVDTLVSEMTSVRRLIAPPHHDLFTTVTRAAFVESFDYAHWTLSQDKDPGTSIWVVGTMRGIVETLIVLSALKMMPETDREDMIGAWMIVDTIDDWRIQNDFFSDPERYQWVMSPSPKAKENLAINRKKMQEIWKKHGFDPGRHGKSNMRHLAMKANLSELYDFYYSFTSRLVHFHPRILLRSGWGSIGTEKIDVTFRSDNFDRYYTALATHYSSLLLAEYIERLGSDLKLSDMFTAVATSIRQELAKLRMPEVVTFEEMNLSPPHPLVRVLERKVRDGELTPEEAQRSAGLILALVGEAAVPSAGSQPQQTE